MKKIIGAALVAALAAGVASADVKITMNGRLRPNFYKNVNTDNGTKETNKRDWMALDGYAVFEDTLKFAFTNKDSTAGATFSMNVKSGSDSVSVGTGFYALYDKDGNFEGITDDKNKKGGNGNKGTEITANSTNNKYGNFLTLNEYNVWAKIFGTDLKIGAGSWKDGFADGAYRVKKDVDAGNAEGIDFERFKLGSIFKSAPSTFVDDLANFYGGSSTLSAYAEYDLKIDDSMTLKPTLVVSKASYDEITESGTTTKYNTGWAGRLQFNMAEMFNSEFIFKTPVHNVHVLALYVQPKFLSALDGTLGGSFTLASGSNEGWDGAWDVDLRLRYQVNSNFSITTFNKISGMDEADDKKTNKANVAVGAKIVDGSGVDTGKDVTLAMWNNLSARYKINDAVTATLNLGLMSVLDTASGSDSEYGINVRVTPGAQLYVASNATLWVGATFATATYNTGASGAKDQTTTTWAIPAIFRVKL